MHQTRKNKHPRENARKFPSFYENLLLSCGHIFILFFCAQGKGQALRGLRSLLSLFGKISSDRNVNAALILETEINVSEIFCVSDSSLDPWWRTFSGNTF